MRSEGRLFDGGFSSLVLLLMIKIKLTDQDIPKAFLEKIARLLGDDFDAFQTSLKLPVISGLRINTLKISPDEFNTLSQLKISPVPWCPSGFILDNQEVNSASPGKHPYHTVGLYYIQDPSAMAAAEILAPVPGERVLDLSAAPGGKASHLAALMKNKGLLVVNEIHPRRVWDLIENIERCGVTNAIATNETPQRLADHFGEYFDRVLLDAPCSGEGMFRKSTIARQEWRPELVLSCATRQTTIIEQAARLVKTGGHLVYTTCTFSVEENEVVIGEFLERHPEFELLPIPYFRGFSAAHPEWLGAQSNHKLNRAVRIWPHLAPGEGHFIALLEKVSETKKDTNILSNRSSIQNKSGRSSLPKSNIPIIEEFVKSELTDEFDYSQLVLDGSFVYKPPMGTPRLEGLKVIRPGLWLGTLKNDRFIPSHTLAMAITERDAISIFNLESSDPKIPAYLAGESFHDQGDNGWVLVTVDGFPIGWGKRAQNVIKNYYPHGLRKHY